MIFLSVLLEHVFPAELALNFLLPINVFAILSF